MPDEPVVVPVTTPTTTPTESTPAVGSEVTPVVTSSAELVSKDEHNKVQREAQNLRARLKEAEEKTRTLELAQLSEQERKDKRLAELEQAHVKSDIELKRMTAKFAINSEAQKLGFIDVETAQALINPDSIEYDSEGNPSNVTEKLEALLASKPFLKAQVTPVVPPSTGLGTNPPTQDPNNPNSPTVPADFDYVYWKANKDKIESAIKNGILVT